MKAWGTKKLSDRRKYSGRVYHKSSKCRINQAITRMLQRRAAKRVRFVEAFNAMVAAPIRDAALFVSGLRGEIGTELYALHLEIKKTWPTLWRNAKPGV